MSNPAEIAAGIAVELVLVVLAAGVLYRVWGWIFAVPRKGLVLAFQQGVLLRQGRIEKILPPGTYWITPKRSLMLCDVRPTPFQVPPQDFLTSVGMVVRMSLGGEYRISDPGSFVTASSDSFGAFYLELRHTMKAAVAELENEITISGHNLLIARINELLIPRATQLGIEITRLEIWEATPIGWQRSV